MTPALIETKQKIVRCAIYTRVSTDQQAEVVFNSCEAQEDRIRSFINSQEGFQVSKVYPDPGYSGANLDRPGIQRRTSPSDSACPFRSTENRS